MATASPVATCWLPDLAVCPICFQKFKKPRTLPCSHTFCHHCLDGVIKSSCSSPNSLGFTCPLCRDFIAAPGLVYQCPSDKWAELFPLNYFMEFLTEKCSDMSTINCDGCAEDGEDVRAINFCKDCRRSFCENCTKMHKKFPAVCEHAIASLGELISATMPVETVSKFCRIHGQNKLDLFCRDHQAPSCSLCVPLLHRTCDHIGSIQEEVIKSDKTNILANGLMKEMKVFCDIFEKIIEVEKTNVARFEEKTDMYSDMVRNVYEKSVQHLKKLEEKQLSQIAKFSKESKRKLEATIEDHENRRAYVKHCLKLINETLDHGDNVDLLLQYSFMKENLREIRKLEIKITKAYLTATPDNDIEKVMGLLNIKMDEMSLSIPKSMDVSRSQFRVINHFTVKDSDIRGGAPLSNGRLLLIDFNLHRCLIYTEKGALEKEVKFSSAPWDVYVGLDLLYITFPHIKEVKMLKLEDLSVIKTFPVNCTCRGITNVKDRVILTGETIMETLNGDFEHLDETVVDAGTDNVAVDSNGNVLQSCYTTGVVKKTKNMKTTVFTYKHPSLRVPYGVDVDHMGNTYVCGSESNNIHVISSDGKTLKILHGFTKPQCVRIQDTSLKFFVIEERSKVKICELK